MKKSLLLTPLFVTFATGTVMAQKFTLENENGNILSYKVLSKSEKTVTVTGRKDKQPELIIPENVNHNGEQYIVTEIDYMAFRDRTTILSIKFPSTLKTIGFRAFINCKKIKELRFPDSLNKIEDEAFYRCEALQTIYIPNSIRSIGKEVFSKGMGPGLSTKGTADDYYFENLPAIVNENSCEKMGISKGSVTAYLAEHPRNVQQQPQVVYVQAPIQNGGANAAPKEEPKAPSSDVDINLPENPATNEHTFAVIFANENYQEEVKVEYALNDGEMFKTYCNKVLGIPADNIHIRKDATLNNMRAEITWMQQVAKAYKGQAHFIVFYAGHGIPDEKTGTSYLLPVDGKGTMLSTGYSLANFYQQLGEMEAQNITVFMDACFSGSKRGDGMLASARGVAIKAKPQAPKGKMVVFSAAQGDETAYPFKEKEHGLFTYYLLKKLKETKGNVSFEDLGNYVSDQVSRKSIVANGKSQTPAVVPSAGIAGNWKTMKLK